MADLEGSIGGGLTSVGWSAIVDRTGDFHFGFEEKDAINKGQDEVDI